MKVMYWFDLLQADLLINCAESMHELLMSTVFTRGRVKLVSLGDPWSVLF